MLLLWNKSCWHQILCSNCVFCAYSFVYFQMKLGGLSFLFLVEDLFWGGFFCLSIFSPGPKGLFLPKAGVPRGAGGGGRQPCRPMGVLIRGGGGGGGRCTHWPPGAGDPRYATGFESSLSLSLSVRLFEMPRQKHLKKCLFLFIAPFDLWPLPWHECANLCCDHDNWRKIPWIAPKFTCRLSFTQGSDKFETQFGRTSTFKMAADLKKMACAIFFKIP